MKKILAAVDFSDLTGRVVDQSSALARVFGAELVVVHVAPPEPEFVGYDAGPQSVRDAAARHYREESRQLQEIDRRIEAQGLRATSLLIQGYAVEKILSEASRLGCDLIVMGSHGHGALRHLLVGSVTEGVLRQARVPVLIVPAGDVAR